MLPSIGQVCALTVSAFYHSLRRSLPGALVLLCCVCPKLPSKAERVLMAQTHIETIDFYSP